VMGPDGKLIGGKTKTPKEEKAGTETEAVERGRKMMLAKLGRPMTDAEQKKVDGDTIAWYRGLGKDTSQEQVLKSLQIQGQKTENEIRQMNLDRMNTDRFGASAQYFQSADGKLHAYVLRRPPSNAKPGTLPTLMEIPSEVPPDATRIQPPSAFQKFLKSVFREEKPTITQTTGGGTTITDPNWGK